MIDITLLRRDPEGVKKGIAAKQADPELVDSFLAADYVWRGLSGEIEILRFHQKKLGKDQIEKARLIKEDIKQKETRLSEVREHRDFYLKQIPNPPLPSVPVGKDGSDNKTLREVGKRPEFSFKPKDYLELAEALGLVDMERAGKVSGSRFGYIMGAAVRLEFALVQFVINAVTDKKLIAKLIRDNKLAVSSEVFVPVIPPVLIKSEMMEGMGYVERGGEEIYFLKDDNMYLVGTSEQSLGPMHSGEILSEGELPKRYLGFSTCFRREAGSYGKDTKGILRVHQFDKLEMFSITRPEWSEDEHKLLLAIEEHLMKTLGVPYRVLDICTGDLGDPAAAKYDIEAWLPGQNDSAGEYRETHSTSNTTDFQSRRLNIRYRTAGGDVVFPHMLNGTAFAIGRILIAIIENYQTADGEVAVPKALQKYAGLKKFQVC